MSESELKQLFSLYAQRLENYLIQKTHDPQLAADIVQDSFLRLAQRLEQQDEEVQDKKAYLYKTANNLVLDHIRHQRRWQMDSVDDEESELTLEKLTDGGARPDQALISQQELARLAALLASLPERSQQIFRLHRLENLTQAEIAQRLNVSLSTVEKHLAAVLSAMLSLRAQ